MTIAVFIFITACVVAYSLAPLLRREQRWLAAVEPGTTRRALEAEKKSYLRAIKDIEFEHASNKINEEDYIDLRKHYGAKAARVMRDLARLSGDEPSSSPVKVKKAAPAEELELALEEDIAAVKEKMDRLEHDWDICIIDDDEYVRLHDEYTKELESILNKLDKEKVQG